MSAVVAASHSTAAPRFGRLVGVEFRRLFGRRFVQAALLLAVIGLAVGVFAIYAKHGRPSPSDLARATQKRDQQIAEIQHAISQCAAGLSPDQAAEQCGPVPTAVDFPIDQFLRVHPLEPGQVSDYALAIGAATATLGFVIGATFIGAEWSSKNLVLWLFWEPRRLRLMAAKLLALLSVVLAVALVAQLLWFGLAHLLLHYRGLPVTTLGPKAKHFWRHVLDGQLRAVLLVLPTSLLGFGMASLIRNTAASFGIGFIYFAVVENLIRALNRDWQPYLFTTNLGAWIANGGLTVYGKQVFSRRQGFVAPRPIHISNLHGAVALLLYAGVVAAAAVFTFRRRDIS